MTPDLFPDPSKQPKIQNCCRETLIDESVPRIETKKQKPIQPLVCSPSLLVSPSYQKLKYTRPTRQTTVPPRIPEDAINPEDLESFGSMEQKIQYWSTVEDPEKVEKMLLDQVFIELYRLDSEKQR